METRNFDDLLQAFVVTGDIGALVRWISETQQKHLGFAFETMESFRDLSAEQARAAVTLAAASFNSPDPYADPEWLAIAGGLRNDPKVSQRAATLLSDLGYDAWESVLRDPPGHAAIWRAIVAQAPDDNELLLDLASDLSFDGPVSLEPLSRTLIDRFIAAPGRTPNQLAQAASMLADRFDDPDAAQALMDAGGNRAENYDVMGIAAEIATARLWNGTYDAASARTVAADLIGDGPGLSRRPFEALRRAKAFDELRRVGDAYLKQARGSGANVLDAVELFATASDCYRLAGDRDAAIGAAREGMPLIPRALEGRSDGSSARRAMAGKDNGTAIAPALALYRAGAEEEAMTSDFVSGRELLEVWDRPLSEFDPQWIVDDTPKWLDVAIYLVIDRRDPAFAARVHDALARTPEAAAPTQLAILAAVAGNADQVRTHLEAARAEADVETRHPSDRPFLLLRTVMAWKTAEMLLSTPQRQ